MKIQSSIEYPSAVKLVTRGGFQVGLVVVTLFLTLYYNFAWYGYTPLTGVQVDYIDSPGSALQVTQVLAGDPGDVAGLKLGDRLLAIDGRAVASANRPLYTPKSAGESVQYTVERAGQRLPPIDVIVGDYGQHPEYLLEMFPFVFLSLLVYALGLLLCLLSAPQDTRARLVGAALLLAGVALAAGRPGYANGGWFVFDVYLAAFAVGGYLSLAAHLYFPAAAFSNRARLLILRIYLGLTLLALAAYACQRIFTGGAAPPEALVSGALIKYIFILTWLANLGLLLKNCFAVQDTETKRQALIILLGTLLGVLPVLLLTALPGLLFGPQFVRLPGNLTVFALVCIPLSYGYVIGQRKLLKIDLLVNRALAWLALIALAWLASTSTVSVLTWLHGPPEAIQFGGVVSVVLVTLLRRSIQVGVNLVLYKVSYDFRISTTRLAGQLSKISDRRDFDKMLRVEIAEQLHIQESKLLLAQDGRLELPQSGAGGPALVDDEICQFLLEANQPTRAISVWAVASPETTERWAALEWGRVFAPIAYNGALHGVLVLGDRLNGNYYSDQDMENIHTVARFVALALANLAAVETLHGLAQRMVRVEEEHRRETARELHDGVLYTILLQLPFIPASQPNLAAQLQEAADSVRQIIDNERTPLLEGDIAEALEDLIDKLRPSAGNNPLISLDNLLPEPAVLDDETITTAYRIVQEALSNAIRHADAYNIVVTLKKAGDALVIEVTDDGVGMEDTDHEPSGHYGLMGMRERAAMIGATFTITSVVNEGTTVSVRLKRGFGTAAG